MTSKAVEQLSRQILEGQSDKVLQPLVDELLGATDDHEDLVSIYKLLPRHLTAKHIESILAAEKSLGNTEVSQSLVLSKFQGLEKLAADKYIKVVHTALEALGDGSEVLAPTIFKYRLDILSHKELKDVPKEQHACAALLHALKSPTYYLYEPLIDSLNETSFQPKNAETKNLMQFTTDVLIQGTGVPGMQKFLEKAGKDFFEKLQVGKEATSKARITALCSLLKGKDVVSLNELKEPLGVKDSKELEEIVINATMAEMVDAAVDRENSSVTVHSVTPLKFDAEAWKQLQKDLEQWMQFTQKCMS